MPFTGRTIALNSRDGQALVTTQVDQEVHDQGYSGVDWSNAPSTTPTTEEHPLRLVQLGSGGVDAAGHLDSRPSRKARLSEDTLESRHA